MVVFKRAANHVMFLLPTAGKRKKGAALKIEYTI